MALLRGGNGSSQKCYIKKKINELWLPEETRVSLLHDKQCFRRESWKNSTIKSFSSRERQPTGKEGALSSRTQRHQLSLARLCSFNFILSCAVSTPSPTHEAFFPALFLLFSFLKLFYFLTSFICNNCLEAFFFLYCYHGEGNFLIKESIWLQRERD